MDIRHLQYFIEVTRLQSFSKAAEELYVTQPTISKMIRNLEEELGVTLFDRSNKKIKLTDAGVVIYQQAKVINQAVKDLNIQLENLLDLKKGTVRIGLPPMIGSLYFPHIIGQFHETYPEISIQLFEAGSNPIEEEIDSGNLDTGVVALPTNEDLYHFFSFKKEKIQVVVPTSHPLASKDSVRLKQLKSEDFILFNEEFALHHQIISSCMNKGFQPNVVSKSSQWDFIGKMVSAHLGITFMPESICKDLNDQVQAIDLVDPDLYWELAIIWPKNKYLSTAAKAWLNFTQEKVQRDKV